MEYWYYDRHITTFFNNIFSTKLLAIRIIAIMFFIETYVKDELIDK